MTIANLLGQGGWAMWPIYICSLIALAVFLQRLWVFRKINAAELPWVDSLLQRVGAMHYEEASEMAEKLDHPVARVLGASARIARLRPDRVEAEAKRVGTQELRYFEQFLPLLALITQIAPLLGLLGTVLGMVQLFFGLQSSGMSNVNAAALSAGIWQALLTTAAGLVVAAPTLAGHHYLTSRVDRLRQQMSDSAERLLHVLPPLRAPWEEDPAGARDSAQPSPQRSQAIARQPAVVEPLPEETPGAAS